ncbi:MAG: hypothetical protein ABW277_13620 [Longimicrobiaceae bacterium]
MIRRTALLRGALLAAMLSSAAACADAVTDAPGAAPAAPRADVAVSALASVNIRSLIDTVTNTIIADSTNQYDVPTATHTTHFRTAVDRVLAGRVAGADSLLDPYAYDVYSIRDATSGDSMVVFRERKAAGSTKVARGWGTYIFNPAPARRVDVHVNHPIDDQHTEDIGSELFRDVNGRWFMMAGARRLANFNNDADVAHQAGSVFNQMHTRVAAANVRTVSIHGFRESNNTSLPDDVDQVLSNGASAASGTPVYGTAEPALRTRLVNGGFVAGLFNVTPGYSVLGATTNVQGLHSNNSFGFGRWIHVETEKNVRDDTVAWRSMNTILRQWIIDFPT